MTIGIGITTHNRPGSLAVTLAAIERHMPPNARVIVVDDASGAKPKSDYRFDTNVGIAVAKNKCLELLEDCEHIFLFDDDCYPMKDGWWEPYVDSPQPHLMYIFQDFAGDGRKLRDTEVVYRDRQHVAYTHSRGCMLYLDRRVLDRVGGFDPVFGRWGWEHPNYSDRIYAAGLTTFPYMDVVGSEELFYSADEHQQGQSTCYGPERQARIERNKGLYQARKGRDYYVPYVERGNTDLVLTCYFTGTPDPQRGHVWEADINQLGTLLESLWAHGSEYLVLHDCFDQSLIDHHFMRVSTGGISPYWQRWVSYYRFLLQNPWVRRVWCVDGTDVEMLRNPFREMETGVIYTGDEPSKTCCPWMIKNHPSKRVSAMYAMHGDKPLRNAGLLGGSRVDVMEFIRNMLMVWQQNIADVAFGIDQTVGESDMGVFNLVAHNMGVRTEHGRKVNTVFKTFARDDKSWWRHK